MFRAYKFVLKPTVAQTRRLDSLLAAQCEIYNSALEERRGAWRWERRRVTRFEQFGQLAGLREVRPEVMAFGVTVARGTLTRLDLAFAAFFRRHKAGQKPGYPRFRSRSRFDSVSWPERSGWALDTEQRRLRVQGVGGRSRSEPPTPPRRVRLVGTWPGRTGDARRCSGVWAVASVPMPTPTPPSTSFGPGWPSLAVPGAK